MRGRKKSFAHTRRITAEPPACSLRWKDSRVGAGSKEAPGHLASASLLSFLPVVREPCWEGKQIAQIKECDSSCWLSCCFSLPCSFLCPFSTAYQSVNVFIKFYIQGTPLFLFLIQKHEVKEVTTELGR